MKFANDIPATLKRLGAYSGNKASYASVGGTIYGFFEPVEVDQNIIGLGIMGQAYKFYTNGDQDIRTSDVLTVSSVDYNVRGVRRNTSQGLDVLECTLELSIKK